MYSNSQTQMKIGRVNLTEHEIGPTAQERLELFLGRIDDYLTLKNVKPSDITEHTEEAMEIDSYTYDELLELTQEQCFACAYTLYQYCDNVLSEMNKQAMVCSWCTSALNLMVSRERDDFYESSYNRMEMKIARLAVDNEVVYKVREWLTTAEARRDALKHKEYLLKKKADCLMEKGKRY